MRRIYIAAAATVITLANVQTASAVCADHAVMYYKHTFHSNAQWPWPYVCPDRIAVQEPFCMMINNGWRRQNLIGAHHFNPETNQLTEAGKLRVQWIVTQAPPDHRDIFVERALDPKITGDRLTAIRAYATQIAVDGRAPSVSETTLMFEGRPASVVDATNVKFLQSMPAPVLPAAQSTSSSSSSQ